MWVQLGAFESFSLFQIHVIYKWEYCINGEMKPNSQPVEIQTVQPNSQSVVLSFYGKTALEPINLYSKKCVQKCLWQRCLQQEALREDTRHT